MAFGRGCVGLSGKAVEPFTAPESYTLFWDSAKQFVGLHSAIDLFHHAIPAFPRIRYVYTYRECAPPVQPGSGQGLQGLRVPIAPSASLQASAQVDDPAWRDKRRRPCRVCCDRVSSPRTGLAFLHQIAGFGAEPARQVLREKFLA
ncbi:hypothetical protein CaCOL14_001804 [Colletotrichum acutatum]